MLPRNAGRAAGRRRFLVLTGAAAAGLALGGCAVQTRALRGAPPAHLPPRVELHETPFFPDDSYYCGPAVLATLLGAAGFDTEVDTLARQVFLPAREGSLQLEMLAGARRNGAVATVLPGELTALLEEVAAGHPVGVLQNLGLAWAPSWHYAVLIGYDLERGEVLLRSGPMKRQQLALRTFEHTWKRGGHWAMVALPPGHLPQTAHEADAIRALVAFERSAEPAAAARAYSAGLERWPHRLVLLMGLGNSRYAQGDLTAAERAFAAAARHDSAAAWNNLALVRLARGNLHAAHEAAQRAHALDPKDANIRTTLRRIKSAQHGA